MVIAGASSLLGAELKSLLEESRFAGWDFSLLDEEIAAGTLTEAGGEPAPSMANHTCTTRDVQRGARQIDDDASGFAGGGEIALREGFRASENMSFARRETAFLDGLDDRRFATSFGESTGGDFFIEQLKNPIRRNGFLRAKI